MLKHGEKLGGDFRVSKQDFQAFEKINAPPSQNRAHGPSPLAVDGPSGTSISIGDNLSLKDEILGSRNTKLTNNLHRGVNKDSHVKS